MKNFKEKILKIGKRKNCFIALLLVALIAFGIVTGLKGSNSANSGAIKANAFTEAPQPKNLDLNGIRYTYQTSLNELKNEFGLFKKRYSNIVFNIYNNTESEIELFIQSQDLNQSVTSEQLNTTTAYINQSFQFGFTDNNGVKVGKTASFVGSGNMTNELSFSDNDLGTEPFDFKNLTSFSVNFSLLKRIPFFLSTVDDLSSNSFTMNLVYVKDSIFVGNTGSEITQEEIRQNALFYAFAFNKQIDYYNFVIPRIENYTLRNIFCSFETSNEENNENTIIQAIPYSFVFAEDTDYSETAINIKSESVGFISNNEANVIRYYYDFFEFGGEAPCFKGYNLLSESEFDTNLINKLFQNPSNEAIIETNGLYYFGGNFANNSPLSNLILSRKGVGSSVLQTFVSTNNDEIRYIRQLGNQIRIDYFNQSRLLYLDNFSLLRATINEVEYDGLSAQVEDVLYNIKYVGNIEEMERNERIEEDLNNLLKLTGLGAVIGLLFGILFGNPVLGLIVGGLFGFFTALFPLLIDGLQAIFGNNFLSGLYDLFKSITNFFARIVDTFINFLMNIITNPFILILIVIIAIIYIVKRYNK